MEGRKREAEGRRQKPMSVEFLLLSSFRFLPSGFRRRLRVGVGCVIIGY
jgi:hypothetical protein